MTVQELITALEEYPLNATVEVESQDICISGYDDEENVVHLYGI